MKGGEARSYLSGVAISLRNKCPEVEHEPDEYGTNYCDGCEVCRLVPSV